jgi:mannosyl-3-phosphoglycerate phosphatase
MTFSPPSPQSQKKTCLAIFTDLDGTLLDHRYSWEPATDALEKLRRRGVPIILCTSKTRRETEHYRRQMGIAGPFVVENGGAILIPRGYFGHLGGELKQDGGYEIIESDVSYAALLAALEDIKQQVIPQALGFSDLSPENLAEITGLSPQEAMWAKDRHHDEPFLIPEDQSALIDDIRRIVEKRGLRYLRGTRFHHITGPHDKGTAVQRLIGLYRSHHEDFFSVGLGDSPMDIPFLEQVDLPIMVQDQDGKYHPDLSATAYLKSPGIGPQGWSMVITLLFEVGFDHVRELRQVQKRRNMTDEFPQRSLR